MLLGPLTEDEKELEEPLTETEKPVPPLSQRLSTDSRCSRKAATVAFGAALKSTGRAFIGAAFPLKGLGPAEEEGDPFFSQERVRAAPLLAAQVGPGQGQRLP